MPGDLATGGWSHWRPDHWSVSGRLACHRGRREPDVRVGWPGNRGGYLLARPVDPAPGYVGMTDTLIRPDLPESGGMEGAREPDPVVGYRNRLPSDSRVACPSRLGGQASTCGRLEWHRHWVMGNGLLLRIRMRTCGGRGREQAGFRTASTWDSTHSQHRRAGCWGAHPL